MPKPEYTIIPTADYERLLHIRKQYHRLTEQPLRYVTKDTPWDDCDACSYCHAPATEPCINMRIKDFDVQCQYPHPQRLLAPHLQPRYQQKAAQ